MVAKAYSKLEEKAEKNVLFIRVPIDTTPKVFQYHNINTAPIITFLSSDPRLSNIIVTHRIKAKYYDATTNKYTFQTKGDANNTADFTLAEDTNIIGEVIFKIPKIGYIQSILATKGGLIIVVLIPCLAILSYDIVKLGKNVKNKVVKKKSEVSIVRR